MTGFPGNSSDFLFGVSQAVVLKGLGSQNKMWPWPAAELAEEGLASYL